MIQPRLHKRVTHEERSFCVCSCVCLEHLWLTVSWFKEQREAGKAERETTSENEDNDCFCTKPESHARLNKSSYCHREAKPQHKQKALYKQQVLQSLYCTQVLKYSQYLHGSIS